MAGKGIELGKERLLFHHLINISQDNYEEQMADAVSNYEILLSIHCISCILEYIISQMFLFIYVFIMEQMNHLL